MQPKDVHPGGVKTLAALLACCCCLERLAPGEPASTTLESASNSVIRVSATLSIPDGCMLLTTFFVGAKLCISPFLWLLNNGVEQDCSIPNENRTRRHVNLGSR